MMRIAINSIRPIRPICATGLGLGRPAARLFALALLAAGLAGCKSQPPPPHSEPFIASYRMGNYEESLRTAEAKYADPETKGVAKDRAGLMVGLSAYALRKPEKAQGWLEPLVNNPDPEISGTSAWTLGMISADRANYVRASTLASAAAVKLKADDAARAHLLAGESFARLGRTDQSKEQYALGLQVVESSAVRATLEERASGHGPGASSTTVLASPVGPGKPPVQGGQAPALGRYVIQLGAFTARAKAEQAVSAAATAASRAGQPAPRVVATTDPKSGGQLFAVQVGSFADRPAAEAALRAMGVAGTVLAPRR